MKSERFLIYGLIDPRSGHLRYVGKSCSGLKRPRIHSAPSMLAKGTRTTSWIKSLMSKGLSYEIVVLEHHDSGEALYGAEQFWIAYFRSIGAELTNHSDGGPGGYGCKWSAESRERLSRAKRGVTLSAEARAKISAKLRGTKASEATKQKLRELRSTPEFRIALSRKKGGTAVVDQHGKRYETIAIAARELGLCRTNIRKTINGKYPHTGGYSFRRVED